MNASMPLEHFLFLSLVESPRTGSDSEGRGKPSGSAMRCINSAGRWAVNGTASAPFLVWRADQATEAQAAAERSAKGHGRSIELVSSGNSILLKDQEVRLFTEASESALVGPAALSSARARRLRTEADKLEAFCMVVRAASAATDHHQFGDVSRAATKALQAKFGGGSITSAFAWLSARAGREALDSVLAGEVEVTGPLSLRQVVEAVALAQKAERLRVDS